MRWLDGIIDSMDVNLGMLQSMGSQRAGNDWVTEHQQQCVPPLRNLMHTIQTEVQVRIGKMTSEEEFRKEKYLCELEWQTQASWKR